ncbi:MAG: Asp/Glu/hydantoin racemase, partial [Actinomycetospora chiangmaiensis]|nr:Asp/Glu/hydantoin racemase [Actinomycetospora chiangmaiensis]
KEELLVALAGRAVTEDEADVVILAGAPLAGLAPRVADRIPVPVVDPIAAAVKQAEALVALQPRKAQAGTFRRPPAKPTHGLPEALGRRIAHEVP